MPAPYCLALGVDNAVRAYAARLPETCVAAAVLYYRADGSLIERADVDPLTVGDVLSVLVAAAPIR